MGAVWQAELDSYLIQMESDIRSFLAPIKDSLERNGISFNDKFKNHFLQTVGNRLSETYDRFEIQLNNVAAGSQNTTKRKYNGHDEPIGKKRRKNWNKSPDRDSEDSSDTKGPTFLEIRERNKQNQLVNCIVVHGVPQIDENEDILAIFMRLCRRIDVKITPNDVVKISRRQREQIKVELRDFYTKESIRTAPALKRLWSSDIMKLPSGMKRQSVFINHSTTSYYLEMDIVGRKAVADGSIYSCELSTRGLVVKRNSRSREEIILSLERLNDFIQKASGHKKQH